MSTLFKHITVSCVFFVAIFLSGVQYAGAVVTPPECCVVRSQNSCFTKESAACKPVEISTCEKDFETNKPICVNVPYDSVQALCHLEASCVSQIFSDTGVFWEYTERQKVKYGLPAELIIKITPSEGYVVNDISCLNCNSEYTSVSVQAYSSEAVQNGGTQMVITVDTKKAHDAVNVPDLAFSVMAEVISNGKKTYTLRRPTAEFFGVTDQLSLCKSFTTAECSQAKSVCFAFNNACYSVKDQSICSTLPQDYCGTTLGSPSCTWSTEKKVCQDALTTQFSKDYTVPTGYDGPLPPCAFDGSCRDVNDLLAVAIKIGELALGFVGSLALVFFVYGGFTMILSMGNAEKVKKGREILIASVIGIVIAFSAYAIVNFTLDVLQVQSDEFRIIK